RGFFAESYNRRALVEAGIDVEFVQDNHAYSKEAGTLRGLHFQAPPHAQTKLVWPLRGAVVDVAVDLRHGSPTFGRHVMVELSADEGTQMLIPRGFAHGVLTLVPDTEMAYKVDAYFAPEHDLGVRWDDPDLAIPWPLPPERIVLSDKDRRQPLFKDSPPYFRHSDRAATDRSGPFPVEDGDLDRGDSGGRPSASA
ncbi:MAG TPA: dTDP-4-dehydrorhamnose 3,5-epimerase, partial [Geminicoccaceae bacterium]|nr:dTDP-4-dehydrorhamnose 3,5-epimerase [Geminicoccaceae bacterium]